MADAVSFVLLGAMYAALGRLVLARLAVEIRGLEAFAWSVGLGTGVGSCFLFAWLAVAGGGGATASLIALGAFVGAWILWDRLSPPPARPSASPRARFDAWAIPPLAGCAVLLVASLAPEVGWDAIAYHLPAAARAGRDGLGPMPGLLDAEYRLGFDLLFVPGLVLDGRIPRGPAFLSALAATALVSGVYAEARRRTSSPLACAVATLLLGVPTFASEATTAGVDVGVGLYGFLAFAAVARALRGESGRGVLAAGLFAGFAAAAKLPALVYVPAAALGLAVGLPRGERARSAWTALAVGTLVTVPWFIRAWVDMGQPFFPLFASTLGSGWADPNVVRLASDGILDQTGLPRGLGRGIAGVAWVARDAVRGGPTLFALAALAVAGVARPSTRERRGLFAAAAVALVAWAWFLPIPRLGFALVAWLAIAAAAGLARLAPRATAARTVAVSLLLAACVVAFLRGRPIASRVGASFADDRGAEKFAYEEAGERFGQAEFAAGLPRPIGLGLSSPAYVGLDAVSLQAMRNGIVANEDWEDPERLLRSLRRLGLRSVVLPEDGASDLAPTIARALEARGATAVRRYGRNESVWWQVTLPTAPSPSPR